MPEIINVIDSFVSTIVSSGDKLKDFNNEISRKEEIIEEEILQLEACLTDKISKAVTDIRSEKDIIKALTNAASFYQEMIEGFKNSVIETKKGMKFIEDFEKHFIVTVFGKVNCGKSSLGNYIMGNCIRGSGLRTKYEEIGLPKVQVYDKGKLLVQDKLNEAEEGEGFGVKSTEATSTIQWFFMGGMAWFDTPGIGSVTMENEELAKEYVKNSDLTIFITNSDAAGTRQDFEELKALMGRGKPVLFLVTMSDTYDEDADDEGNIIKKLAAKSDKDRKDVEDYLLETIRQEGLEDILEYSEILTISTKLAQEGIRENDRTVFESSNMSRFYEKLSAISSEKALEFKKINPRKRINKLIDDIIGDDRHTHGISMMEQQFKEILTNITNKKQEISNIAPIIMERLKIECNSSLSDVLFTMKSKVENDGSEISSEEISDNVWKIAAQNFSRIAGEEIGNFLDGFEQKNYAISASQNIEIIDMKKKQDRIPYEFTEVYKERRDPNGIIEKVSNFFGKEYYTSKTKTTTRYSTFDIGVNDQEILLSIMNQFDSLMRPEIESKINKIILDYFGQLEKLSMEITVKMQDAKNRLNTMYL
ncbi:MAG TPA: dynamin family protein [Clostridia bacterium]|nr:dynamin family protein [Clostridia bacterium]